MGAGRGVAGRSRQQVPGRTAGREGRSIRQGRWSPGRSGEEQTAEPALVKPPTPAGRLQAGGAAASGLRLNPHGQPWWGGRALFLWVLSILSFSDDTNSD